MNNRIQSFDVLTMIAEEADERFAPFFIRKKTAILPFESICKEIDDLLLNHSGIYFEIEVDEITMQIRITLSFSVASDALLDEAANIFISAGQITFASVPATGEFLITYHFPGIWEKNPLLQTQPNKEELS